MQPRIAKISLFCECLIQKLILQYPIFANEKLQCHTAFIDWRCDIFLAGEFICDLADKDSSEFISQFGEYEFTINIVSANPVGLFNDNVLALGLALGFRKYPCPWAWRPVNF